VAAERSGGQALLTPRSPEARAGRRQHPRRERSVQVVLKTVGRKMLLEEALGWRDGGRRLAGGQDRQLWPRRKKLGPVAGARPSAEPRVSRRSAAPPLSPSATLLLLGQPSQAGTVGWPVAAGSRPFAASTGVNIDGLQATAPSSDLCAPHAPLHRYAGPLGQTLSCLVAARRGR